jgi:phage I-like protein
MPYPNEHAAPQREPGDFLRIAELWSKDGIRAIGGPLKSDPDGPTVIQSIRFDPEKWTVAEAKKWLTEHEYKIAGFEQATGERANAFSLALDLQGAAPREVPASDWYLVAVVGQWAGHPRGPFGLTPDHLRSMAAQFGRDYAANRAQLLVDWEHQSLAAGARAPAAGWIDQVELRANDYQLWSHIGWNEDARQEIAAGHYRYLSPVYLLGGMDRLTGETVLAQLGGIALTNRPFLTELPAVVNRSDLAGLGLLIAPRKEEVGMKDLLKLIAGLWACTVGAAAQVLGLKEDAADELVFNALATKAKAEADVRAAGAQRAALVLNALGVAADADEAAVKAKVEALKAPAVSLAVVANALGMTPDAKPEDMVKVVNTMRQAAADNQAEQLVEKAVAAGRIAPAVKSWWIIQAKKDLADTQAILNAMPPILGQSARGGSAAGGEVVTNLTDSEKALAHSLGAVESEALADKAEFLRKPELQQEFITLGCWLAYQAADRQGRVKIVGNRK